MRSLRRVAAVAAALLGVSCGGSATPAPGPSGPPSGKIAHIVVLVQENRSFDNIFAGFPGANSTLEGACKAAASAPWCPPSGKIALHSVTLEHGLGPNLGKDIDHSHNGGLGGPNPQGGFVMECDANASNVCQMDGFDLIRFGESGGGAVAKTFPYAYVDRSESEPYWDLAKKYTLADAMFFDETASSFISHQMLISGTVQLNSHEWVTDQPNLTPWGCDSIPGDKAPILHANGVVGPQSVFPCFHWATIADLLDAKRVTWLDYVDRCCAQIPFDFSGGTWNGFRAIHKIFHGPDWKSNISSPNTNIFLDISSGKLPSISWVIPTLYDSDHPASGCNGGPWWVTKVVNAIGTSQYWKDTAVILVWDDWGGWYDNAPPTITNPSTLGFRVPMIVISPYARPANISHTQYDFGSILKFIEETFNLGSLGKDDAGANSMQDVFNYSQAPNKFTAAALPRAMSCKSQVTNPKAIEQLIEHDGGVPE